jgi:predicted small lipoprotein YifL
MMRLAIILLFALLLQGCGQKGPLTLPSAETADSNGAVR